jgi:hypothetical protein
VPQEFMSQTDSVVRSLDQSRDVGHHEGLIDIDLDTAQVRVFRGERIVGDLWSGS